MSKVIIKNELLFAEVERMLNEGHEVIIPTKGFSMLPFIVGEKDCVRLKKAGNVKVGDIVLARIRRGADHEAYVLHRVWSVEGEEIELMGDGNLRGRERCTKKDITGFVTTIEKKGQLIDCQSEKHLQRAGIWRKLLPLRRWLLAVYRRTMLKWY